MLFGIEAPKIIINPDTTKDEVALDYSVILQDEPEQDLFSVKAVRTGKRVFNNAGKHWIFKVKIHLWKYADPSAKYLELKSYVGTEVILYRHSDYEPIYDSYGNIGRFFLQPIVELYSDRRNKYDVLLLTFRSNNYILSSQFIPGTNIFEEDFEGDPATWDWDNFAGNNSGDATQQYWQGDGGGSGTPLELTRYIAQKFYLNVVIPDNRNIIILADMKSGNVGTDIALGVHKSNLDKGSCFFIALPYATKKVTLQGAVNNFVSGSWDYEYETNYDAYKWNSFKIVYTRSSNSFNCYIKEDMTGTWQLLNPSPIVLPGFDALTLYAGIWERPYFTVAQPYCLADNLEIRLTESI